jgi:pimeloyl-ACP methyl ester carboxylesterase
VSLVAAFAVSAWTLAAQDDGDRLLLLDHYVTVRSSVPAMAGQATQIYVRERVRAATALRQGNLTDRVVLFVHGAGTPAEVAFDVAYEDYSWMAALARGGFDVFAMDMTGYGRSTRPAPMNDPCNLAPAQQAVFTPGLLKAPCSPTYPGQLSTIASDWNDSDAVVDYLRDQRRVDRVSLIGWSLGGPRAGGYATQHPEKVHKLVLLSPAYNRSGPAAAPALPAPGVVFNTQSRADFDANWDRQIGCANQFDMAARESVWSAMIASDPVGATWGPGVRRAPQTTTWGWNRAAAANLRAPLLAVAPVHDAQVVPARVRELYEDAGSARKVLLDLGCSSHNALWERQHGALFAATREWLAQGTVSGHAEGVVRAGY